MVRSIDARPDVPPPAWLKDALSRLEGDARLDPIARVLDPPASWAAEGGRGSFLRGDWLGHALHPLMTDIPIGCWTSAMVLDVLGGKKSRKAAQRLIGIGLLAVPLTAASGSADYAGVRHDHARRVGAVHAAGNAIAALCYFRSWRSRRRGRHVRGVGWGLLGGGLATVTGYLGGHLAIGRNVGGGVRGMTLDRGIAEDEVIDARGAAALLDVPPEQIDVLVDEGLLSATVEVNGERSFRKADVLAARLVGG